MTRSSRSVVNVIAMLRYAIMSLLGIGVITLSPSAQAADARSTGDTLEEVVVVFARGEALIARD